MPTKDRPRLKKAIADAYTASFSRSLDPETEIVVTTGTNESILSAFMAFVEPGDEVVVLEPFFDQYLARRPLSFRRRDQDVRRQRSLNKKDCGY